MIAKKKKKVIAKDWWRDLEVVCSNVTFLTCITINLLSRRAATHAMHCLTGRGKGSRPRRAQCK